MKSPDRNQSVPCPASEPIAGRQEQPIRAYQSQLRRLASELSLAEARGRGETASDLHDDIGQAVAYVVQQLRMLQGNAVFSGMDVDFSEILTILNQAIRYTRDLTVEISPPVLYELGLPAAMDWLADRAARRHGFAVHSSQSGEPQELSENMSVFLFKAVQELITNVAKHVRATPNYYGTDKLAVINLGVTAKRELELSQSFSLPLTVGFIPNPKAEVWNLVVGIRF